MQPIYAHPILPIQNDVNSYFAKDLFQKGKFREVWDLLYPHTASLSTENRLLLAETAAKLYLETYEQYSNDTFTYFQTAEEQFNYAAKEKFFNEQAISQLANFYLASGNNDQAFHLYQNLLKDFPCDRFYLAQVAELSLFFAIATKDIHKKDQLIHQAKECYLSLVHHKNKTEDFIQFNKVYQNLYEISVYLMDIPSVLLWAAKRSDPKHSPMQILQIVLSYYIEHRNLNGIKKIVEFSSGNPQVFSAVYLQAVTYISEQHPHLTPPPLQISALPSPLFTNPSSKSIRQSIYNFLSAWLLNPSVIHELEKNFKHFGYPTLIAESPIAIQYLTELKELLSPKYQKLIMPILSLIIPISNSGQAGQHDFGTIQLQPILHFLLSLVKISLQTKKPFPSLFRNKGFICFQITQVEPDNLKVNFGLKLTQREGRLIYELLPLENLSEEIFSKVHLDFPSLFRSRLLRASNTQYVLLPHCPDTESQPFQENESLISFNYRNMELFLPDLKTSVLKAVPPFPKLNFQNYPDLLSPQSAKPFFLTMANRKSIFLYEESIEKVCDYIFDLIAPTLLQNSTPIEPFLLILPEEKIADFQNYLKLKWAIHYINYITFAFPFFNDHLMVDSNLQEIQRYLIEKNHTNQQTDEKQRNLLSNLIKTIPPLRSKLKQNSSNWEYALDPPYRFHFWEELFKRYTVGEQFKQPYIKFIYGTREEFSTNPLPNKKVWAAAHHFSNSRNTSFMINSLYSDEFFSACLTKQKRLGSLVFELLKTEWGLPLAYFWLTIQFYQEELLQQELQIFRLNPEDNLLRAEALTERFKIFIDNFVKKGSLDISKILDSFTQRFQNEIQEHLPAISNFLKEKRS